MPASQIKEDEDSNQSAEREFEKLNKILKEEQEIELESLNDIDSDNDSSDEEVDVEINSDDEVDIKEIGGSRELE